MIYCEIKQKEIEADTISFSGNTISDSGSGFGGFSVNDKVLVSGSLNGSNDVQRKITSAAAGSIVVDGAALTAESAGNTITIQKIDFYADPDGEYTDARGVLKYYSSGILSVSEVAWKSDVALVNLTDGTLQVNRKFLLGAGNRTAFDLKDKTKPFQILIKYSKDDSILFNDVVTIIRDLGQMAVIFQLKTSISDADWLDAAADINNGSSFTQGRVLPKAIGTNYHFDPLLQFDSTYQYYSGGTIVTSAYDKGQVVEFNNVTTSYAIGFAVQYNGLRYLAAVVNPTTSPTGAATNNAGWNYSAVAVTTEPQFQATAFNFTLANAPTGRVTIDVAGEYNTLETLCETLSGLVKVPNQMILGDGIAFDNATNKITDTYNRLNIFVGEDTDITGQRILVTGGVNDGVYFRIDTVASDGSEMTLKSAPTTAAAGTTIKIEGFYGFSSEFSDATAEINHPYDKQQKVIDVLKEVCDFHEHIFYFDSVQKLMYLIDKEDSSGTISADGFKLNLENPVEYLTKEVIFSFYSDWQERIPVLNPTQLLEQDRRTETLTEVETGSQIRVTQYENNNTNLTSALEKKRDLYLNYDRIEVKYTIDGDGIDINLFPGKKISFSDWISGDLFVQEVIKDIENGENIARGIATNIIFEDV